MIVMARTMLSLVAAVLAVCLWSGSSAEEFTLPNGPQARPPVLQVDAEGRAFVAAGNQLFRLNRDLVIEQSITLPDNAVNISLSSGGEWLVVCTTDLSCAVHNASNLSAVSPVSGLTLAGAVRGIALFATDNSFYTGSFSTTGPDITDTISMRLTQSSLDGSGVSQRLTNYSTSDTNFDGDATRAALLTVSGFIRDYFSGFVRGNYTYYLVSDHTPQGQQGLVIMRVCHCSGGSTCPPIRVLAEETINCGTGFSTDRDGLCGVSIVEDYVGESGTSIVISRCRPGRSSLNLICLIHLSDIDRIMDTRARQCQESTIDGGRTEISWIQRGPVGTDCPVNINGMCDINLPIGDFLDPNRLSDFIPVSEVIDISDPFTPLDNIRNSITASVAVKVDSFSLMVVAYTSTAENSPNFIGIFEVTSSAARLTRDDAIVVQPVSSLVRTLQWHSGLDYVLAATDTQIFRFPIEECSSNVTCATCVVNSNPLCGWCVVENKCSRQSLCQNGDSTRWIPSNPSINDVSTRCISNTITPDQFLLDDQQELSVSVGGPGLPALLENEIYSCHLEDREGRFNITVPAMEVTPGTNYTCNITNHVPEYEGVQAVMDFSFSSSLVNVPFDTTEEALTIHRCSAATSCTDCLAMGSACGWCSVDKICRGLSDDCTANTDFLQLAPGETFLDVCPLLDAMNGVSDYTQHVRVANELQLTTRNLPATVPGFRYVCRIRNTRFEATRNNESSLTCHVTQNMLVGISSGSSETADISILWVRIDQDVNEIDILNDTRVVLYDCQRVNAECSFCIGTREAMNFQCGYCQQDNRCSISGECTSSPSSPFITEGQQCPDHVITGFTPTSGPPNGGTIITITGTNLGVRIEDFGSNSIDVGGVACTPLSEDYVPGRSVSCRISGALTEGSKAVTVVLTRSGGDISVKAPMEYMVVAPSLNSVEPEFGPIAGGSMLRLRGTGLDIGNEETVIVSLDRIGANGNCDVMMGRNATEMRCTTSSVTAPSDSPGIVEISINNFPFTLSQAFSYRSNPNITSVLPQYTIPVGGITLTFSGENLDVSQRPIIRLGQEMILCNASNSSTLTCLAPPVEDSQTNQRELIYTLMFDNFQVNRSSDPDIRVEVRPNPSGFSLDNTDPVLIGKSVRLQINAMNLDSVVPDEILVYVGEQPCNIDFVGESFILCDLSFTPEGETLVFSVTVIVGNLNVTAGELRYIEESTNSPTASPLSLTLIIPAVVVPVAVVLLCCVLWIIVIICVSSRVSKKKEQQYTNLIAKMELLEYEMADECKRAFTELQTDLADLVQISSDKNLPYRDFRTFAMRFLFPKAGEDHPVLHPLKIQGVKLEEEQAMKHLDSFKELIMNKKFLLVFVHTLESQQAFSLQDKVTVASLLMVAFQNDLDYATDVLQTLLAEMMRKSIAKSHPKLLLRRTETVAEKMLANWLAFLLFPYLLEHVGEPLFILFRAIKSQLEKGPVDVVSGEAKNSLSEEKLLRQHLEVKPVEGVIQNEDESDEVPIKMWDCDSITQAKEKILDALYRNTPVSKRPQLTAVDLELISKGNNGITLRDQDATNAKDGEWTKINTLGHYKLEEMSKNHIDNPKLPVPKFRLVARSERPLSGMSGFDTLGTIISNISAANRSSMVMSASELNRSYHLVKPEPEDGDGTGQKIMSEVYLTRLLSTKRILQPYVDKLFESIFDVPHGKVLPKAIKCLFDFLDLQASELGITDSEVLHSWKTNSVPLRFWVNVIKNPDFVFDINKSATVDSCLTVIAQAYIDATSTADIRYTKDTPSARLLYVNEVKKYKAGVENYYSSIQALPKLSNGDMSEYLRETAQVCANSVKQYDPTVVNDPALMTRKLYFVTESALYELFKVASEHSDDIIDALNEEGLTIPAAQFDQVRKALAS